MLSSCLVNKHNIENYLEFNHPHQIKIRKIFEKFLERKINKKVMALMDAVLLNILLKKKDISKC